jgi:hypothetical protein
MGKGIIGLFALALIGAGFANALAHPAGDKAVLDGFGTLWRTGVNGMLGKAS